jgi:hypothetical protein
VVATSRSSPRRDLHPNQYALLGVSHVVDPTLGSHAYRIGGGGAWNFISIPGGTSLVSSLIRDYWCVGLKARTETLCLCDRRVSGLPSRRTTVSNQGTLHISQGSSLLRRRVVVGLPWFWVVWVVLSKQVRKIREREQCSLVAATSVLSPIESLLMM